MCLQDYNDEEKFSQDDLYILIYSNQVAIALQRRIMLDNLITARRRLKRQHRQNRFHVTMSHEIRTR